jgi:hypothetical protein
MTDMGDNAADAAVLNDNDASIMLLALSGRGPRCVPRSELLHVQKRLTAAVTRLEVVKTTTATDAETEIDIDQQEKEQEDAVEDQRRKEEEEALAQEAQEEQAMRLFTKEELTVEKAEEEASDASQTSTDPEVSADGDEPQEQRQVDPGIVPAANAAAATTKKKDGQRAAVAPAAKTDEEAPLKKATEPQEQNEDDPVVDEKKKKKQKGAPRPVNPNMLGPFMSPFTKRQHDIYKRGALASMPSAKTRKSYQMSCTIRSCMQMAGWTLAIKLHGRTLVAIGTNA